MRILRVKRGFTTNSSASSEWVPPTWKGVVGPQTSPSGTAPTTAAPSGGARTESLSGQGGTSSTASGQITGPAAETGTTVAALNPSTPSTSTNLTGNSITIGLVAAGILLAFAGERFVRRMLRKSKGEGASDD